MNKENRTNNESTSKIKHFTDLDAWKKGHQLVLKTYQLPKKLPKKEPYGLTSQIRRSAVSIISNIAEGFSRRSYKENVQFYSMALGSLTELQNQSIIAKDVNYFNETIFEKIFKKSETVHKIINGLTKSSRKRCS